MSSEISEVNSETSVVKKKRNMASIFISSLLGGGFALFIAPTIAVLMPVGAVGFVLGTVTTGAIGSLVTKVTGNAIDANSITLTIQQYPLQQFYRQTVNTYIGTTLDSVVACLRTNTAYTMTNRVFFDVGSELDFQGVGTKEKRRMLFDLSFRVVPLDDMPTNRDIPAPALSVYDRDATRTHVSGNNKGLLDGCVGAVLEGAAFGLIGGAVGRAIPRLAGSYCYKTTPSGTVNIILNMSSATGLGAPLRNLTFPSAEPDRAALFVEFVTEVQEQLNRLVSCAADNGVGLEFDMKIGSTTARTANVSQGPAGAEQCEFYWDVSGKVNRP